MALMSKQLLADPVEENSCQDLAWHREEITPLVDALLDVTLSLPDWTDNAPSPLALADPRVPHGKQQSVHRQKSGGSPSLSISA